MQKVYCMGCEYFDMNRSATLTPCDYIKKKWVVDTPIAQEYRFEKAFPYIDNEDNNCFYYTPRQPKKKEPTHILGKVCKFLQTYFG